MLLLPWSDGCAGVVFADLALARRALDGIEVGWAVVNGMRMLRIWTRTFSSRGRSTARLSLRVGPLAACCLIGVPLMLAARAGELGPVPKPPSIAQAELLPRRDLRPFGPTFATLDTSSRESVRNFFSAVYGASRVFSIGWTGSHATCTPGATAAAFRDQVEVRLNYYRAMAGVPAGIAFNGANLPQVQAAALMMSANNALSHEPPPGWTCYSNDGATGALNSNLSLGHDGPEAVDAYMDDFGSENGPVGHRRWILYPQTQLMESGDIPFVSPTQREANALWVLDGHYFDPRPATRDGLVAWPPPGFVPAPVVFNRWSLSYPQADFATATVTVTSNGVPLPLSIQSRNPDAGENSIVWLLDGLNANFPSAWPSPPGDLTYHVAVTGVVVAGAPTNFAYDVQVFDPIRYGADTVLPTPSGAAQPIAGIPNTYTFAAVPLASSYEWRRSQLTPFTAVEGGETGLGDFQVAVSAGYSVLTNLSGASGMFAFHLAHTGEANQRLTYTRTLCPRAGAALQFRSRLGWATPSQTARISVSVDGGVNWAVLYQQSGTGGSGEASLQNRSVSLANYEGRTLLLRFSYDLSSGPYYPQSSSGVGWYFDDLTWTNTDEATQSVVTPVGSGLSFPFTPPAAGPYALQARGLVAGLYPLEWSPIVEVQAQVAILGRRIFYNQSKFDGNNAAANASDDGAIAPNKVALRPGQTATFTNYTSYSKGINGIMIDIGGLPGTPTSSDFEFKIGNNNTPGGWAVAPAPTTITVRPNAGASGSHRLTLIWTNGTIKKTWLQVTVKATAATGLAAPDVFYFGNAIAESGDSAAHARVEVQDELLARVNPRGFFNPAPIDFFVDYDRDGNVNATDQLLARINTTSIFTALRLITVP